MSISRQQLAALSDTDLRTVINNANDLMRQRQDQRQRDLWNSVVTAMQAYKDAFGGIIFRDENEGDFDVDVSPRYDNGGVRPGVIFSLPNEDYD